MINLSIDIETYSSVDLTKCGVYKYAESEDFEVLLFAYSVDEGPVQVVDLACGEKVPDDILRALEDENVIKWAFNAQFERVCLARLLGKYLKPQSWHCSLVWAATLGLPLSLEGVGKELGLEKQKLTEGKELIRYFCKPCKPSKANSGRNRNLPMHDIDRWQKFKSYNARDVVVEQAIQRRLANFPVSKTLWEEYELDQEINDRGIALDMDFVEQGIAMGEASRKELLADLGKITGLENPNSVVQLKTWFSKNGYVIESLNKKEAGEALENCPEHLKPVLELRNKLAKNSIKKYTAMKNAVCRDGRAHGMFMFYGANRTGRFTGRIVQLHNLPQNHMSDLDMARSLVRRGKLQLVEMLYDDVPDTLSQLIRTAFIPGRGKYFIVADFSSIEARVLAWLAGERWRLKAFAEGKDIYCQSASQMFGVPVEKNGVNAHLRQKGKIAELALGYGGGVVALKSMGALEMGLTEEELEPLVAVWRSASPLITNLWWEMDRAVRTTIKTGITTEFNGIRIFRYDKYLFLRLPSGRKLAYVNPAIGINMFSAEAIVYDGINKDRKWSRLETYGPKIVENIVQGIARDILMFAMQNLKQYRIVAHVHDEVIIEADENDSVEDICRIMSQTPCWARGLKLKAEGYECGSYRKM